MAVVLLKPAVSHFAPPATFASFEELLSRLSKANLVSVPVDVDAIAEFLGLEVSDELMNDDISGYLEFRDGVWIIGVNSLHHINRRRFTIAHEIAHYILHRDPHKDFVDKTFARRRDGVDSIEREADDFAAKMLMPEDKVREAIRHGHTSLRYLSELFQVSALALKFRLMNLGYTVR